MGLKLSGLNPRSYLGVEPASPPQFEIHTRAPTANDYLNFNVGTLWLHKVFGSAPTIEDLYMLVSKDAGVATWRNFASGITAVETLTGNSGGAVGTDANDNINVIGDGTGITIAGNPGTNTLTASLVGGGIASQSFPTGPGVSTTSGTTAVPTAAGVLNVLGAHNIDTGGAVANTITVFGTNAITLGDLSAIAADNGAVTATTGDVIITAGDLTLPNTNTAGNQGIIKLGGNRWISNFGTVNTFVGQGSGNTTLTGDSNVGVGQIALEDLTTGSGNVAIGSGTGRNLTSGGQNMALGGLALMTATTADFNTAVGTSSLDDLTTGSRNTAVGYISGQALTTGSFNVFIGQNSADSYTGAESSNIIVMASGTTGESNTIRIGTSGAADGQQNRCFIAGIRGITTGVADAIAVLIDSANQLGTVSSAMRYKQNIKDMGNESNIIYSLRPVTFNYRKHPDVPAWGLIAEEVESVFPQLVVYKDNEPETVKYHDLVPLLLNEVIKLNQRVEALERESNGRSIS